MFFIQYSRILIAKNIFCLLSFHPKKCENVKENKKNCPEKAKEKYFDLKTLPPPPFLAKLWPHGHIATRPKEKLCSTLTPAAAAVATERLKNYIRVIRNY